MKTPDATENTLGLLRGLPPEISLDQVGQMVAAFPLAAAVTASWFGSINLNSILMTSAGTLAIGSAIYLLVPDASTARTTEHAAPAPVVVELTEEPVALEEPVVVFEMPRTEPVSVVPMQQPLPEPIAALPPLLNVERPAQPHPMVVVTPASSPIWAEDKRGSERSFDLRNFTAIALHGHLSVEVEQGEFSIRAVGEADALERLHLEVGGGTLVISAAGPAQDKTQCQSFADTKVIVRLPDLSRVDVHGSGTVDIGELRRSGDIALNLQGSGDVLFRRITGLNSINISLTGSGDVVGKADVAGLTKVQLSGSGDVHIAGTTKEIDLSVIGSGDLDASELDAKQGRVQVQGSGDAYVNCSGPLERSINGYGDIHLSGNAGDNRQRGVGGNTY